MAALSPATAVAGVTPHTSPAVIDNHCHLGPYRLFWQPRSDASDLVRTMDRAGIAQSCVFSTLAVVQCARDGNDLSLAAARAHPDRLLAYAVIDPHRPPDESAGELQRCLDAGARGIKLHTGLTGYPFDGPGYAPALAFADAHRLPLISHGVGTPETLRRAARAHSRAHLIVAHAGAGGPSTLDLNAGVYQVAREEPNVYLDTASSVAHFGAFAAVVRAVGAGKVLFGSDMPWMCASYQVGRVEMAPIAAEEKRLILGATMARLLSTRC
jgi:predicted TIM-barrel fold metal-dependent hydrolase